MAWKCEWDSVPAVEMPLEEAFGFTITINILRLKDDIADSNQRIVQLLGFSSHVVMQAPAGESEDPAPFPAAAASLETG